MNNKTIMWAIQSFPMATPPSLRSPTFKQTLAPRRFIDVSSIGLTTDEFPKQAITGIRDEHRSTVQDALAIINKLDSKSESLAAGDVVFNFFEHWLEKGDEGTLVCDYALANTPTSELSDTVLVAILAVTLAAKNRLPSRQNYLDRALKKIIQTNGSEEADLIKQAYE